MTKQRQAKHLQDKPHAETNEQLERLKTNIFDSAEAKQAKIDLIKEALASEQYQTNSAQIAKSLYEFHSLIERDEVEPA